MPELRQEFVLPLLIWGAAAALVVLAQWRGNALGTGLVIAFLINQWMNHWLGAVLYALPSYAFYDPQLILDGFEQSVYAVLAFAFAVIVLGPMLWNSTLGRALNADTPKPILTPQNRDLPRLYLIIGVFVFLLSFPLDNYPTLTAIVSSTSQLLVVGLCLLCWQGWHTRNYAGFMLGLILAASQAFVTIVTQGFLGYGTVAFITVFSFVASFIRPRLVLAAAALVLAFVALSFYVTYMRDRTAIRAVVWGGQPADSRITRVVETASTLEWFDWQNRTHLFRIDQRLNQNFLVGSAVRYVTRGHVEFAEGETIWDAFLALIPRVLWTDKPLRAGGNALVSLYTGIGFARGTSVGIGPVMEFYVNFGSVGVIAGFLVLGTLVSFADRTAAYYLWQGDWERFLLWFLPGLGLLQIGDSLVTLSASTGAGLLTAILLNRFLIPTLRRMQFAPGTPLPSASPAPSWAESGESLADGSPTH